MFQDFSFAYARITLASYVGLELDIGLRQGFGTIAFGDTTWVGLAGSGPTADASVIAIEFALGPARSLYVVESTGAGLNISAKVRQTRSWNLH